MPFRAGASIPLPPSVRFRIRRFTNKTASVAVYPAAMPAPIQSRFDTKGARIPVCFCSFFGIMATLQAAVHSLALLQHRCPGRLCWAGNAGLGGNAQICLPEDYGHGNDERTDAQGSNCKPCVLRHSEIGLVTIRNQHYYLATLHAPPSHSMSVEREGPSLDLDFRTRRSECRSSRSRSTGPACQRSWRYRGTGWCRRSCTATPGRAGTPPRS